MKKISSLIMVFIMAISMLVIVGCEDAKLNEGKYFYEDEYGNEITVFVGEDSCDILWWWNSCVHDGSYYIESGVLVVDQGTYIVVFDIGVDELTYVAYQGSQDGALQLEVGAVFKYQE